MVRMQLNRLTHTRDDSGGIAQYYNQSIGPGAYATTNLVPDARSVNPLAVEQLLVYPREGFGLNNKNIDADSILRNQPEWKNNRMFIRPQNRPFLSVHDQDGLIEKSTQDLAFVLSADAVRVPVEPEFTSSR